MIQSPKTNTNGPIVLVSREIAFTFPLSYAYLAGYLREKEETVIVLFKGQDPEHLIKRIIELNPLLVGFGNLYPELKETKELIALLDKFNRNFPVVIGGQMVSPTPEFAVEITGADFGIIGEGEIILHQLVKALRENGEPKTIKGLVYRQGNDIISNGPGEYIEDLSKLPPIPYDLFPLEQWLNIGRWYTENAPQPHWRFKDRVVNVHGGRGCPFKCNFCYHHSKPRYRPVKDMISEAEESIKRFNANMLYFSDDLVLATPDRARQLVAGLRSLPKKIEYSVSARFDSLMKIDDSLLAEMKETGCRIMGLGIESGSDRILKIIGKNVTSAQILEQLQRLKKIGILPTVSIMIGQETETIEDVQLSMDLMIKSVRQDKNIQYAFTIATPFPGSKLHKTLFSRGLIKSNLEFYQKYFFSKNKRRDWSQVANLSAMSNEQVLNAHRKIKRTYLIEKTKQTNLLIPIAIYLHVLFGSANKLINRLSLLFPKTFNPYLPNLMSRYYAKTYDTIQLTIERKRLKMHGCDS